MTSYKNTVSACSTITAGTEASLASCQNGTIRVCFGPAYHNPTGCRARKTGCACPPGDSQSRFRSDRHTFRPKRCRLHWQRCGGQNPHPRLIQDSPASAIGLIVYREFHPFSPHHLLMGPHSASSFMQAGGPRPASGPTILQVGDEIPVQRPVPRRPCKAHECPFHLPRIARLIQPGTQRPGRRTGWVRTFHPRPNAQPLVTAPFSSSYPRSLAENPARFEALAALIILYFPSGFPARYVSRRGRAQGRLIQSTPTQPVFRPNLRPGQQPR